MISNERPSFHGHGHEERAHYHKPYFAEEVLKTERIQIERKTFIFTLRENPRGRYLRITEDAGGRRDTIIIPATGLEGFTKIVNEISRASKEIPPTIGDQQHTRQDTSRISKGQNPVGS